MAKVILCTISVMTNQRENDFDIVNIPDLPKEATQVESCISQLESPIRVFLEQYKDKDRGKFNDDTYLFMLCSDKVRTNTIENSEATAADYLLNRLLNEDPLTKKFETENNHWNYEKEINHKRFIARVIPYETFQPMDGIKQVVAEIRKLNQKIQPEVYIAANGGPRDDYLSMITIVKLLKIDNIYPKRILSTEFTRDVHNVYCAEDGFNLLDYAFALNEFFKSGNASDLREYFKNVKNANENHPLMIAMDKISKGARYCQINQIEDGLKNMHSIFNKKKMPDNDTIYGSPEFQIFSEHIKEDYGEKLLEDRKDRIETIRWCLRKDLLQQALTFAESKTGDDMNEHGILAFDEKRSSQITSWLRRKVENTDQRYRAEAPHHMLLDDFQMQLRKNEYGSSTWIQGKNEVSKFLNLFYKEEEKINEISHIAIHSDAEEFSKAVERNLGFELSNILTNPIHFNSMQTFVDSNKNSNGPKCPPVNIFRKSLDPDTELKARMLMNLLMNLYFVIKTERNNMNHAGDKMPNPKELKAVLNVYCDVAEALYTLVDPQ